MYTPEITKDQFSKMGFKDSDFNWIPNDRRNEIDCINYPEDNRNYSNSVITKDVDGNYYEDFVDGYGNWNSGCDITHWAYFPPQQLEYIKGNIFEAFESGKIDILAHACNQTAGMGAGIARLIVDKYESNWEDEPSVRSKQLVAYFDTKYGKIANVYAMINPGPFKGNPNDSFYKRVERFYNGLLQIIADYPDKVIGIPLVLSGLARGKQKEVMSDLDYFKSSVAPELHNLKIKIYYI